MPGATRRNASPARLLVAAVATAAVALLAAGAWVLGQAQYLDGYCVDRVSESLRSDVTGGRPVYLDGPWTVVCEYDGRPPAEITEPLPLIGALILAALVAAVGLGAWRWARRPVSSGPVAE